MTDVLKVADGAEMIVNGYAFTKCEEGYQILNLNRPDKAIVLSVVERRWRQPWMTSKYRL